MFAMQLQAQVEAQASLTDRLQRTMPKWSVSAAVLSVCVLFLVMQNLEAASAQTHAFSNTASTMQARSSTYLTEAFFGGEFGLIDICIQTLFVCAVWYLRRKPRFARAVIKTPDDRILCGVAGIFGSCCPVAQLAAELNRSKTDYYEACDDCIPAYGN